MQSQALDQAAALLTWIALHLSACNTYCQSEGDDEQAYRVPNYKFKHCLQAPLAL